VPPPKLWSEIHMLASPGLLPHLRKDGNGSSTRRRRRRSPLGHMRHTLRNGTKARSRSTWSGYALIASVIPGQRAMLVRPELDWTRASHSWPRHGPVMERILPCWPARLEARPRHGPISITWVMSCCRAYRAGPARRP
jgi:hypothetical protein